MYISTQFLVSLVGSEWICLVLEYGKNTLPWKRLTVVDPLDCLREIETLLRLNCSFILVAVADVVLIDAEISHVLC